MLVPPGDPSRAGRPRSPRSDRRAPAQHAGSAPPRAAGDAGVRAWRSAAPSSAACWSGHMAERSVAYVLKGYPRLSELFIASEIWRLEQLGNAAAAVRAQAGRRGRPASASSTRSPRFRRICRATTSLSATAVLPWLRANARPFRACAGAGARRHPPACSRAAAAAGGPVGPGPPAAGGRGRSTSRSCCRRSSWPTGSSRAGDVAPPARPLRPRRDHGDLARRDDHRPAVLLHRPRQGHLPRLAEPRRAAARASSGRRRSW